MMAKEKSILSIQSTVVFGYAGNKAATFPLQLHGYDVSPVNSVQFSNHLGYPHWKGQVLNADDVSDLFEGLRLNNLMRYSHVITGFIGCDSFLQRVGELIKEMKTSNPDLIYVCDPVMGDNGRVGVSKELVSVYRDFVVEIADILTPNQLELETLTKSKISSESEAFAAINKLHDRGVPTVVLTSSELGEEEGILTCLVSQKKGGMTKKYRLKVPKLNIFFIGTGDLFTSSFLAWLEKKQDIKEALEKAVCVTQAVIKHTINYCKEQANPDSEPTWAQKELRLIQSRSDIENPQVVYKAEEVV